MNGKGRVKLEDVADPTSGFATIGDIRIRTDSFQDLRWDRVMPILIEEQVFMCHQMLPPVLAMRAAQARGLNILDLGAGSGVFGIYLDHQLNRDSEGNALSDRERSNVVCLDLNPRAIRFIQENAEQNRSVQIRTRCERYSLESVAPESQDVIIINPPYHPVYGHWAQDVALHGAAGEDGLAVFREWIHSIAAHLRPGGLLIGSVMSPTGHDGKVVAMEELSAALGHETTRIQFARHLEDPDTRVRDFLSGVYAAYLDKEPDLFHWISRMEDSYSGFTVVYFEAEKAACKSAGIREDLARCRQNGHVTWLDRIQVHAIMTRQSSEAHKV
jgi:methylase of polypeptide subunit release factors